MLLGRCTGGCLGFVGGAINKLLMRRDVTDSTSFKIGGEPIPEPVHVTHNDLTYDVDKPRYLAELVKQEDGLRHQLDSKSHPMFFNGLAQYFDELDFLQKVEQEIEALNSDRSRDQSTKSARLVGWLVNTADHLKDPKFGLTAALADRACETLDVEMSRYQALILLANAMLLRLDGQKNPVWHRLDHSKFPLSGTHALSAFRKGFNMETLLSSWPQDDSEYQIRKEFNEASLHKAILLVHALEQLRQLEATKSDEAVQYMQQTLFYKSASFYDLKLDTIIIEDKQRDFRIRTFSQNGFFNHRFSLDAAEMKGIGGVLPNCKANFANINNLIGAISHSATAECTNQVTMMELLISMLFKGMLQPGEAIVTAGAARATSKITGLHKKFRTQVKYGSDTTEGQLAGGSLDSKSLEATMAARVIPEDAEMLFFAHPIVISVPATEIGTRRKNAEGMSVVSATTKSEFVESFKHQRTDDFHCFFAGAWQAKVMLRRQYQDHYGTIKGIPQLVVSSGKWGGGAFNNNVVFKAVQQYVIAAILDVKLYHSTFFNEEQLNTLNMLKALLTDGDVQGLRWREALLTDGDVDDKLGAVHVWPLYELITGDTKDLQTLKDVEELDSTAGDIFIDRKERATIMQGLLAPQEACQDNPDFDDHELMVLKFAEIMLRRRHHYFSNCCEM
jgi:hypothetical protein